MTNPNPPSVVSKPIRPTWFSGCITMFAIFLGILGILDMVLGLAIAYIFFFVHMFSPANIAIVFIIVCNCLIYFILAFRIKRQHWLISLALLGVVWLVLPLPFTFFINTATMRLHNGSQSMESVLPNDSYLIANKQAYQQRLPQRGDVIVYRDPSSPDSTKLRISRIIGLPGDVVTINQGQVSINGTTLNEPYVTTEAPYSGNWKITESQYFVLGDNRANSYDSHAWGTLPRENILAKAVWIYWPFIHFGKISDFNFSS